MQNSRNKIILILLLLLISETAFSGGTRTHFLSHGPSVAAYGRGETGTAADDLASTHYNPSLLTGAMRGSTSAVTFSHYALFDGSMYNYLGAFYSFSAGACLGFSAINLRSGDVEIRQRITDTPAIEQTNHWSYQLSTAKRFKRLLNMTFGMNLKYIVESLHGSNGTAYGIDIGAFRELQGPYICGNASQIAIGASVLNCVPPRLTLIDEEEVFESSCRLGVSLALPVVYRLRTHDTLSVLFDVVHRENELDMVSGIQYGLSGRYFIRGGYFSDHLTAGMGGRVGDLALEYAVDFNALASLNRLGITYYWNPVPHRSRGRAGMTADERASLMKEARQSLREARLQKAKQDREVLPLIRTARKQYRRKQYLLAADAFREIMLRYPEYAVAKFYYEKITSEMDAAARLDDESDLEMTSYARGYQRYRQQDLAGALNEWDKVLQINPQRHELVEYVRRVGKLLGDLQRSAREKELDETIRRMFDEAINSYESHRWVTAIKQMEKVRELCKKASIASSLEWYGKAQELIDRAVQELARAVAPPSGKKPASGDPQRQAEIDSAGADRKYNDGLILYAQGKVSDALHLWEIALRLNPGHEKARKAAARAREELLP